MSLLVLSKRGAGIPLFPTNHRAVGGWCRHPGQRLVRQAGRASFALATGLADMQIAQAYLVGYMSYGGHTSPLQAHGVRLCCLDSSFIFL